MESNSSSNSRLGLASFTGISAGRRSRVLSVSGGVTDKVIWKIFTSLVETLLIQEAHSQSALISHSAKDRRGVLQTQPETR